MQTVETKQPPGEAAILTRVLLNGEKRLSHELARLFLGMGFSDEDKSRMHDLAVRNQEGKLRPGEADELDSYRRAGYFIDIMRSKARLALKKRAR